MIGLGETLLQGREFVEQSDRSIRLHIKEAVIHMGHRLAVDVRQIHVTAIDAPLLEIGHHPLVCGAIRTFVVDGDGATLRDWAAFSNRAVFRGRGVFSHRGLRIWSTHSVSGVRLRRSVRLINHRRLSLGLLL